MENIALPFSWPSVMPDHTSLELAQVTGCLLAQATYYVASSGMRDSMEDLHVLLDEQWVYSQAVIKSQNTDLPESTKPFFSILK